jgi:hypothetical protein
MTAAAANLRAEPSDQSQAHEQRAAPRFTSLIRSAKLVSDEGEFVCVVRDVSSTGVRLRCFHAVPRGQTMAIELQNGELFTIERVRDEAHEASFRFASEVPIERLICDSPDYPRRLLRLNIAIPLSLRTLAGSGAAKTQNLSQQGCRVECTMPLALAQSVVIETPQLPGIRAKVRWRRGNEYGLVFDDTFTLKDFAIHAARLQCPSLAAA